MNNADVIAAVISGACVIGGGMLTVAWRLGALTQRVADLAQAFKDHTANGYHNTRPTPPPGWWSEVKSDT